MAYVICNPCIGCVDTACYDVCPMDCIDVASGLEEIRAVPAVERNRVFEAMQSFINPELCIDCDCCATVCPVGAIHQEDAVPVEWQHQIELNAEFFATGARGSESEGRMDVLSPL